MFFFYKDIEISNVKPRSVEHGYLAILNDDIAAAAAVFESIDSPRAIWGKAVTDIISGYIEKYPTYFEIRNFLEIDLDFLIKNEKISYTEQILSSLDFLSGINQEVYKYAARVMLINKLNNAAFQYMEKSKKCFYQDPELHFMLSKYYLNENNYEMSEYYINECLKIIPSYFPAIQLKKILREKL